MERVFRDLVQHLFSELANVHESSVEVFQLRLGDDPGAWGQKEKRMTKTRRCCYCRCRLIASFHVVAVAAHLSIYVVVVVRSFFGLFSPLFLIYARPALCALCVRTVEAV